MFSKNLTKEGYEVIIKDYLAPFMANHPMDDVRLIQDNDRKHSSELCISALAENNIQWVLLNFSMATCSSRIEFFIRTH